MEGNALGSLLAVFKVYGFNFYVHNATFYCVKKVTVDVFQAVLRNV